MRAILLTPHRTQLPAQLPTPVLWQGEGPRGHRTQRGRGTMAASAHPPMPSAPATGSLLQTILALMLVLGLLLGLAWFMKRFGARVMGASANVKLVGALNIGGRERIMVVEVGNQWIVVGASPGRVNALATMPRQEGAQEDGATLAPHAASAGSFGDWLKNTIDKRNAK
nr:flagellar biosynthetic protein FliO [Massilia sp. LC238]